MMATWLRGGIRLPLLIGAALLVGYALLFGSPYHLRLLTVSGIYALMVFGLSVHLRTGRRAGLDPGRVLRARRLCHGDPGQPVRRGFCRHLSAVDRAAGAVAALIAVPVLRLESHYFALATLGISQVLLLVAIKWEALTGGANGLTGVPGIVLFGAALPRGWPMLLVVWGLVALGAALAWRITRGLTGRAFHLMRENGLAAQSVGLDNRRAAAGRAAAQRRLRRWRGCALRPHDADRLDRDPGIPRHGGLPDHDGGRRPHPDRRRDSRRRAAGPSARVAALSRSLLPDRLWRAAAPDDHRRAVRPGRCARALARASRARAAADRAAADRAARSDRPRLPSRRCSRCAPSTRASAACAR